MYRKKAKICKLSETEVITDNSHCSSVDKNDKPESDMLDKENKNDLPMSQCQPMLLSQSGKFIPKFMAKTKVRDCVVKMTECASRLVESDNCGVPVSMTDVGIESLPFGNSSAADEVKDTDCACADSVSATDACEEDGPAFVESSVDMIANKRDESGREQVTSPNNGPDESTGSNSQGLLVDTTLHDENMGVSDRKNDNDCERHTIVEEKESRVNGDVLGEVQHCRNSSNADQHDVKDLTQLHFFPPRNISNRETTANTSAVETVAVSCQDCTQPKALEIASHEDSQRVVITDDVMDGSKTDNDKTTTAILQTEVNTHDASDNPSSEEFTKVCGDVPPVLDVVETDPDAAPSTDDARKVAEINNNETAGANAGVSGEIYAGSKTVADHFAPIPVNSAPAKDPDAESDDDNEVNTQSDAREINQGSAALPSFDDFLDLTDSQLCQLDDVSR